MDPITLAVLGAAASTIGKGAVNTGLLGEMTPAAAAQRRLVKEARTNLTTGNFGMSAAEKQQATAGAQEAMAGTLRQMRADAARSGNPAALNAAALGANAMQAQAAGQVQQASNALAQNEYQNAQNRIDQQADRLRALYQSEGFKKGANEMIDGAAGAFSGGGLTPEQMQKVIGKYGVKPGVVGTPTTGAVAGA